MLGDLIFKTLHLQQIWAASVVNGEKERLVSVI